MALPRYSALLTDLYELTMLAGYFAEGMHEEPAVFDLYFRTNPYRRVLNRPSIISAICASPKTTWTT